MKSKFEGLSQVRGRTSQAPAPVKAVGRPKQTSADSVPVTLHLSAEIYRRAKIKMLETSDERPLSKIVEDLLGQWIAQSKAVR